MIGLLAGCARWPMANSPVAATYQPNNYYRSGVHMPASIRRVSVLPMNIEVEDWQADHGRAQLEPVLIEELGKAKLFELVLVPPEQLRTWTGRTSWRADEVLPPDFLERLQQTLGSDAVLFSHLRSFHSYQPLVIGWTFKLVDSRTGLVLWSADEVFDASEAAVACAARKYHRGRGDLSRSWSDTASVLGSPRRFGQYTLSALLATLPER